MPSSAVIVSKQEFSMLQFFKINSALARALSIVASVGIIVTGVTFAALQSQQAVLSGNTIQSATASLLIGTASATSTAYSSSHSGFSFNDIVTGAAAQPAGGNVFYLKNTGTATLSVKLNVNGTPTNPSNEDLGKVKITVVRTDTNTSQTTTLQALIDSTPAGGLTLTDTLAPSATGTQYTMTVSMTADAFNGSSATIGAIDFSFSGTGV
jgi:hypothetical protein